MIISKINNKLMTFWYSSKKQVFGKIIVNGKVNIQLAKDSKVQGSISLGYGSMGNNRQTLLRMDPNSKIISTKKFDFMYGCDIILFKGAELHLGASYINSDAKIRCHKFISIGDNCAISHDFTVMDSNVHFLNGSKKTEGVIIHDNVWIGTRVTILSGVEVGRGSVIAAGSVVTKSVPENVVVAGNPAKVIKENIEWSK